MVSFNDVKAWEITDRLNIAVTSIDGTSAEQVVQTKHISIVTMEEYRRIKAEQVRIEKIRAEQEIIERHRQGIYFFGEQGPGGGIVFYDKGSSSKGWRYLEAAPAETEFRATWNEAMAKCRQMNYGGVRDWRMPDKDELNWMYQNLKRKGLENFENEKYWSSSEQTSDYAWYQDFSYGGQYYANKRSSNYVRAMRAF